nr:MAG TPA_asm: hypothetical protein [Caudoviricetes sp.]
MSAPAEDRRPPTGFCPVLKRRDIRRYCLIMV